jgi:hypothetical protein
MVRGDRGKGRGRRAVPRFPREMILVVKSETTRARAYVVSMRSCFSNEVTRLLWNGTETGAASAKGERARREEPIPQHRSAMLRPAIQP